MLPMTSEESVRGGVEESDRWLAAKVTEQDEFDAEALTGTVPLVTVVVVVLEDMASTSLFSSWNRLYYIAIGSNYVQPPNERYLVGGFGLVIGAVRRWRRPENP